MSFTVYEITHIPSGAKYIGQTAQRLGARWATHKYAAKIGKASPLYDVMRDASLHEFEIKALAVVPTREYALMCEEGLILAHRTRETGFNVSLGVGSKGCERTPEQRREHALRLLGREHSLETKEKMRAAKLGKSTMTDEGKQRLREFRTGNKWSDEARAKASASKRGKPWSEARRKHVQDPEYRAKMKAASIKGVEAMQAKREQAQ